MGKHKRMVQRAAPATLRHYDLKGELERYGVRSVYDLPVEVHYEYRAQRLSGVM